LTEGRRLIVNRPIHKTIGEAQCHFIALYDLRKFGSGEDGTGLGSRYHELMHRELDVSHWNWFCLRGVAQRHRQTSG
jgi:hypothetical protein